MSAQGLAPFTTISVIAAKGTGQIILPFRFCRNPYTDHRLKIFAHGACACFQIYCVAPVVNMNMCALAGALLMGKESHANVSDALLVNNSATVASFAYVQQSSTLILTATCWNADQAFCLNVRSLCSHHRLRCCMIARSTAVDSAGTQISEVDCSASSWQPKGCNPVVPVNNA